MNIKLLAFAIAAIVLLLAACMFSIVFLAPWVANL